MQTSGGVGTAAQNRLLAAGEDSLKAFIAESELVRNLDEQIAMILDVPLMDEVRIPNFGLRAIIHAGVHTIESVRSVLSQSGGQIIRFANLWLNAHKRPPIDGFPRGISLLYCAYYIIVSTYPATEVAKAVEAAGSTEIHGGEDLAKELLDTYAQL